MQFECLKMDPPQLGGCGSEEGAGRHVPCTATGKKGREVGGGKRGGEVFSGSMYVGL